MKKIRLRRAAVKEYYFHIFIIYKIPRTILINWAEHWQDDQNWKPYDMS